MFSYNVFALLVLQLAASFRRVDILGYVKGKNELFKDSKGDRFTIRKKPTKNEEKKGRES